MEPLRAVDRAVVGAAGVALRSVAHRPSDRHRTLRCWLPAREIGPRAFTPGMFGRRWSSIANKQPKEAIGEVQNSEPPERSGRELRIEIAKAHRISSRRAAEPGARLQGASQAVA